MPYQNSKTVSNTTNTQCCWLPFANKYFKNWMRSFLTHNTQDCIVNHKNMSKTNFCRQLMVNAKKIQN